jgi:hypothetical protein
MFAADSRYAGLGTYTVTLPGGRVATATNLPLPPQGAALAGFHRKVVGDRLDLLAARYLNDPTWTWKLCDANGAPSPDALIARPLIGIPRGGGG